MKDTSQTLYKVGNVFNIIKIVLAVICAILMFVARANIGYDEAVSFNKELFDDPYDWLTVSQVKAVFMAFGIFFIIITILLIVENVFAHKAKNDLSFDNLKAANHIVALVLGVFTESLFYVIAAIFGLVYYSKKSKQNTNNNE